MQCRHGRSDFEKRHHALFSLMCIYGIELLADNVAECRENLLETFDDYLGVGPDDVWTEPQRGASSEHRPGRRTR